MIRVTEGGDDVEFMTDGYDGTRVAGYSVKILQSSIVNDLLKDNQILNYTDTRIEDNNIVHKYMRSSYKNVRFPLCASIYDQRVRLRSWDEMVNIFGLDKFGRIACNIGNNYVMTRNMHNELLSRDLVVSYDRSDDNQFGILSACQMIAESRNSYNMLYYDRYGLYIASIGGYYRLTLYMVEPYYKF